ncbi:MAG: aegerolysin family protein [Crocinitomicaceae bacterium]|nr:aegerolysin family protein [Crocinitomicaceae bacterium]
MSENMKAKVIVKNFISEDLTNATNSLDWGKFTQGAVNCPGLKVTNLAFAAEGAANSATGTQGWVQYKIGSTDYYIHIAWDVPYIGANSFSSSIIPAGAPFQTSMTGPHRQDDNTFTVTLNNKIS